MFTPIFKAGASTIPMAIAVSAKKPSFSACSTTTNRFTNTQIRKKILQINANLEKKENPAITVSL